MRQKQPESLLPIDYATPAANPSEERPFLTWLRVFTVTVLAPITTYQAFQTWDEGQRWGAGSSLQWPGLVVFVLCFAMCVMIYVRLFLGFLRWRQSRRAA